MNLGISGIILIGAAAVLAVALIAIYIYFFIRRILVTFGMTTGKKWIRIVNIAAAAACGLLCVNIFSLPAMILFHIIVLSMAGMAVNFVLKKIWKEKYDRHIIWKKIYGSGAVVFALTAAIFIYGHRNMMNVVETDCTVFTDKDIRDGGYRAALLADVHIGVSLDWDEFREKCKEIESKNVDMVLLCGDIVDENTSKEDMVQVFKELSGIDSTYGVYYVYGNHDRQLYSTGRAYTEEELKETMENFGITVLQDEIAEINDELVIVGREDASYSMTVGNGGERAPIASLLNDIDDDRFVIVMDHQPKEYRENMEAGTDLLLSGHTHAGQMWPLNIAFGIIKFDDAVYGYTKLGRTQAFVTSGFAGWGYSVKTSSPAEYVIMDIREKNE